MKVSWKKISSAVVIGSAVAILPAIWTGCASTPSHESTGEYIDDSSITAKVKASMAKDPIVSALEVHVITYRGVVELSGFVQNHDQIEQATKLAREVEGVRSVKNSLMIKPAS